MKTLTRITASLPVAALLAIVAAPAGAQSGTNMPGDSTQNATVTTRQSITVRPYYHRVMTDPNAEAITLHNQAVDLAHQATYAAQHGNRKLATSLAGQAQDLFNQAFTLGQNSLR